MKKDLKIRPATRSDVDFIASTILWSIEKDPTKELIIYDCLRNLCIFDDTLYSYLRTTICEVDGIIAGAVIKYDGGKYKERRDITFDFIKLKTGIDLTPNVLETGPGEFYIDSLYVDPEYRGFELGKKLIEYCTSHCLPDLIPTLLVDSEAPGLQKLYSECGFMPVGNIKTFGRTYIKMQYNDKT